MSTVIKSHQKKTRYK